MFTFKVEILRFYDTNDRGKLSGMNERITGFCQVDEWQKRTVEASFLLQKNYSNIIWTQILTRSFRNAVKI